MAPKNGKRKSGAKQAAAEEQLSKARKSSRTKGANEPLESSGGVAASSGGADGVAGGANVNLLEQVKGKEVKAVVRKQTDQQRVQALIERRFSFMPQSALTTERAGGLLLEERLLLEMALKPYPQRIAQSTIIECLISYGSQYDPILKMGVPEADKAHMKVSETLLRALEQATMGDNVNRTIQPLRTHLKYCSSLNAREFVGVVKELYTCIHISKQDVNILWHALLSCVVRLEQKGPLQEYLTGCKSIFDNALKKLYMTADSKGAKPHVWITHNAAVLGVVIDERDLNSLRECKGNWSLAKDAVARVYNSTQVGACLFKFAQDCVANEDYRVAVENAMIEIKRANFDFATVQSEQAKCAKAAIALKSKKKNEKRVIAIKIATITINYGLKDDAWEFELRLAGHVKTASLGFKNGLELMPHERFVIHVDENPDECKVPASLLDGPRAARELFISMLDNTDISNFDDLKAVFVKGQEAFEYYDASWCLEHEWVKKDAEKEIDDGLHKAMLAHLPTAEKHPGFTEVIESLSAFKDSEHYKFASKRAQANLKSVLVELDNVKGGGQPNVRMGLQPGFLADCLNQMQWFASYKGQVGKVAVVRCFNETKAQTPKERENVDLLQRFKWLLAQSQKNELFAWSKDLVVGAAIVASASSGSTDNKPSIMRYF